MHVQRVEKDFGFEIKWTSVEKKWLRMKDDYTRWKTLADQKKDLAEAKLMKVKEKSWYHVLAEIAAMEQSSAGQQLHSAEYATSTASTAATPLSVVSTPLSVASPMSAASSDASSSPDLTSPPASGSMRVRAALFVEQERARKRQRRDGPGETPVANVIQMFVETQAAQARREARMDKTLAVLAAVMARMAGVRVPPDSDNETE